MGTPNLRFILRPQIDNQNINQNTMAHSEGHSSTERTILWIIIPATILVSLYFTWQSKKHEQLVTQTELSGDLGSVKKKEAPAPAKTATSAADTLHMDTLHVTDEKAPATPEVKVEQHSTGH